MDEVRQAWQDRVEVAVLAAVEEVRREFGQGMVPSDVMAREIASRLWEAVGPGGSGHDDAKWVRTVRGALGLSQYGLARRIGATQRTVARWEAGKARPAPVFRTALERLVGREG